MAGIFHFVTARSLQELAQALSLALPRSHTAKTAGSVLLLDTSTLALRQRNWLLILASESGDTSLSLRRLNHQTSLRAPASGRLPLVVQNINHRALRERLQARLGGKQLQVVQSWHVHGLRHECRNEDGKIECTLLAQQYRAPPPASLASPVLVELLPKRGYERETANLAQALLHQLPWSVLARDAFELLEDLSVAAATTQRADAPPLRPATATTTVASWLLDHHTMMCSSVAPGAAPEVEQLHDLRVAMRHSRSLLRAYRGTLGRELARHFQREFRWLSTATSRLRDIDVLHAALLELTADYATLAQQERQALLSFLEQERARDACRLQGVLDGNRYRRLRRTWPLALAALINLAPYDAPSIAAPAAAAIGKALARLQRDIIAVESHHSPSVVHELRKQCKRVRYLVVPCASLYPREQIAAVQSGLRQLQSVLGECCDRYAQLTLFEGHLWRCAKGHTVVRAALRSARLALRQKLAVSDVGFVFGALQEFEDGRYTATLESLLKMPDL